MGLAEDLAVRLGGHPMPIQSKLWYLSWALLHEGHGHGDPGTGETWWHYFTEPAHLPVSLGSVLALAFLSWLAVNSCRFWLRRCSKMPKNTSVATPNVIPKAHQGQT